MNINLARKILTTTKEAGVHEYIVCAGARNSPLVFQLAKSNGARIFHFFEERSAGFFALGRMKCTGKPVAVVTTSGTAVAELLPATIEAHYSQLPLVIISADRPRNYRNTGAPQSIEQLGLFSHYVEKSVDVESTDESADLDMWSGLKPIHINVCFDEPLIDGEIVDIDLSPAQIKNFNPLRSPHGKRIIKPAVIVGGLKKDETIKVVNFLKAKKIPVYAEVNSQIFGQPEISFISERTLEILVSQQKVKSLIRIGSIPTLRLWRDLESKYNLLPVYSCSEIEYTGLSRSSHFILGLNHLENLIIEEFQDVEISEFIQISNKKTNLISELLKKYPLSEVALLKNLSQQLSGQNLYLGNSLPIREMDLVIDRKVAFSNVDSNRGANGIDGQISTFLGLSEKPNQSWGFFGDLTTLYDLSSLWATPQLQKNKRRIVVINNHGGQIFKGIFKNDIFLNSHQIEFKDWAQMWKWDYLKWQSIPENILNLSAENLIIELKPDNIQSESFWQEYKI